MSARGTRHMKHIFILPMPSSHFRVLLFLNGWCCLQTTPSMRSTTRLIGALSVLVITIIGCIAITMVPSAASSEYSSPTDVLPKGPYNFTVPHRRLAVIVPFTRNNVQQIVKSLSLWSGPDFTPCVPHYDGDDGNDEGGDAAHDALLPSGMTSRYPPAMVDLCTCNAFFRLTFLSSHLYQYDMLYGNSFRICRR
jgi:hypothetical protein